MSRYINMIAAVGITCYFAGLTADDIGEVRPSYTIGWDHVWAGVIGLSAMFFLGYFSARSKDESN